nr:uncharacterized protein LOC128691415 [Cherax quadricarinatus]
MRSLACTTALLILGLVAESQNSCEIGCLSVYKPVCGTDGNIYGNSCELKRRACSNPGLNLEIAPDSNCPDFPSQDDWARL